jgi:hypothetical protein
VTCTPCAAISRRQSLTSTPGVGTSCCNSTILKAVHGAYLGGRLAPDGSAVKANT